MIDPREALASGLESLRHHAPDNLPYGVTGTLEFTLKGDATIQN